jgi:hypothetical protein
MASWHRANLQTLISSGTRVAHVRAAPAGGAAQPGRLSPIATPPPPPPRAPLSCRPRRPRSPRWRRPPSCVRPRSRPAPPSPAAARRLGHASLARARRACQCLRWTSRRCRASARRGTRLAFAARSAKRSRRRLCPPSSLVIRRWISTRALYVLGQFRGGGGWWCACDADSWHLRACMCPVSCRRKIESSSSGSK